MAVLLRTRSSAVCSRFVSSFRSLSSAVTKKEDDVDKITHTGQQFEKDDYRRVRFLVGRKLVNPNIALDLIAEDPVVVCDKRVIPSDSGGPLGHPKVFINLDKPEIHVCGYSGRKFIHKRYYDEKTMGPSISYEEYMKQMKPNSGYLY
ncbi:hypothetical protein LSH36_560g00038 [Paralvinella palmiformis]|uniref:Zinc finger CHCC-type domain-containing protein n=1 Tax=Paralvinella palmiformis TaxID=53620 RepID=A0AAD9J7I5_9ANNE|nr:hypothetical protein LSH36_560g00038 [Paralvinella palmiformis]